jgi:hypothetical protein
VQRGQDDGDGWKLGECSVVRNSGDSELEHGLGHGGHALERSGARDSVQGRRKAAARGQQRHGSAQLGAAYVAARRAQCA